jgi:protein FrlC
MKKKFSIDRFIIGSYQYGHYPIEFFLDTAARLHFQKVELWAVEPQVSLFSENLRRLESTRRMADDRGLSIFAITPEQIAYPVNIAAEEDDLRRRSIAYYRRGVDAAAILGAGKMLVTAGCGYFSHPREEAFARSADSLRAICEYAKQQNVQIVLEAVTPMSSNVVNSPEDQKRMIEKMPENSMIGMLDIGSADYMHQSISDYLQSGVMGHVHFHDSHPAVHMVPGDGDLPLDDYLQKIEDSGYQGYYSFEFNDGRYRSDPATADERAVRWLEQHGIL